MNGKVLLDTNIVIAYFNQESSIKTQLEENVAVYVPSIVIGELYYGAYTSTRATDNIQRIDSFTAMSTVLACDVDTAHLYGQLKARLRAKGRPIPENDIWIAAIALQHDLALVTRDEHFNLVDGLAIESW